MEDSEKKEYTPQQYKKFNGQSLVSALKSIGGAATAATLCELISASIDKPEHVIKPEVMQVLRRGISNGFLERRGKNYLLYAQNTQIDYVSKKGPKGSTIRKVASKTNTKKVSKMSKLADGGDAKSVLETLLKASREAQKAATQASEAARRANTAIEKITKMSDGSIKNKAKRSNAYK